MIKKKLKKFKFKDNVDFQLQILNNELETFNSFVYDLNKRLVVLQSIEDNLFKTMIGVFEQHAKEINGARNFTYDKFHVNYDVFFRIDVYV